MRRIVLLFILLFSLSYLVACSSTSAIQSGPIQYDESRAERRTDDGKLEDVPVIRSYNTVLLRQKPVDGVVKSFAMQLGKTLNGITPAGVVSALGTSPERAFSELESGRRAQFSWAHLIDNPSGQDIDYSIEMSGVNSDTQDSGQTAVAESVKIKISSTQSGE
jgi:hypothetical protein